MSIASDEQKKALCDLACKMIQEIGGEHIDNRHLCLATLAALMFDNPTKFLILTPFDATGEPYNPSSVKISPGDLVEMVQWMNRP
jgi:plastocyanin